jgi:ArsR family transcriptional regulator
MRIVRPGRAESVLALSVEVAPAYDLILSLAAAAHPRRYELTQSWARAVRQGLPSSVRGDLTFFFADPQSLGLGMVQAVPDLADGGVDPFLRHLESMAPADFVASLLSRGAVERGLAPALRRSARGKTAAKGDAVAIERHLASLPAMTRTRFEAIIRDAPVMHQRYCALLRAHAAGWFGRSYDDIAPIVLQRARQGRRSIGKLPAREVISRLTGGFTLHEPKRDAHATRSVLLVPAYFAAPFVFVVRDGQEVVMVYGARPAAQPGTAPIDAQAVRVLKALADETRLRILQMLAERPLYGQQLADALGVSHPTISHHMAQLRIAGLTRTELAEDGNKTYSVRPETIEELSAELRAAFVAPVLPEIAAPVNAPGEALPPMRPSRTGEAQPAPTADR